MAPSWRRVHYALRPAKNVERKIIAETLARLDRFSPLAEYRYVGLGSLWFIDFALFHRRLGFAHMVSIEDQDQPAIQQRFRENRPFSTEVLFGRTTKLLPSLAWDRPSVIWLDYDREVSAEVIEDVSTVASATACPSILLVTLNVEPGRPETRVENLVARLGDSTLLPDWVTNDSVLAKEGTANAAREIFGEAIARSLDDRNGVLDHDDFVLYRQLFNLRYSDGAEMLTVGGILYHRYQTEDVNACQFDSLPHVVLDDQAFRIDVPLLTVRETLQLDQLLPAGQPLVLDGVPTSDVEAYRRVYRFLPAWVDVEL